MNRSTSESARKPGRPARGEEAVRRDGLLKAALDVFLLKGLAGTSLDDIARVAHVAKRTIYRQFGGKETLFAACIERAARELIGEFSLAEQAVGNLRRDLTSVGCTVLAFVLRAQSLSTYRMVVGESARQPALGRLFYERGPARVIASVAALLKRSLGRAVVSQAECERLARDFVGLVVLEVQQRAVFGLVESMSPAEIEAHVTRTVAKFLAGLPREMG